MKPLPLAIALLFSACTDTEIYIDLDPDEATMRLEIEAQVCAPPPIVEEVPYKILFVIDTSLSNTWNDPIENRVDAYLDAVETHRDRHSVYFGIITFNDYAHRPTLVFTNNQGILLTAAGPLGNDHSGGGTNYEDAIHEMYQFIVDDLNAISNPQEALRTHYQVYWLSDGFPTFGTTDRDTLTANIEAVVQYLGPKVAEFKLNTLYLESTGEWETEEEIAGARLLLKEMAEAGGGAFTNIASGESFEFDIRPLPQIRTFGFAAAVASNLHAYFGVRHPHPDSDADGAVDVVEVEMGLDPTNADTDGDFYRDGIELRSEWLQPDRPDQGCTSGEWDSDSDGLRDCEEEAIGTDAQNPDTDADFLPDGIEYMLEGSVMSADPIADSDLDHTSDFAEVLAHLDPRTATSDAEKQLWGYQYQLVEEWIHPDTGRQCYTMKVANVSVYETLQTPDHPQGWQLVEMVVAFVTDDGTGLTHFLRAEEKAGMLLPRIQYPPSGILRFAPEDFELLGLLLPAGGELPECDVTVDPDCGCQEGQTRTCGTDEGSCKAGVQVCLAGRWSACEGEVGPQDEVCSDSIDNNCDGAVDETCPGRPSAREGVAVQGGCASGGGSSGSGWVLLLSVLLLRGWHRRKIRL